jgi:outer membrane protein assembly factor BamA
VLRFFVLRMGFIVLMSVAGELKAQDAVQSVTSRAQEIQAQQVQKSGHLEEDSPDRIERRFIFANHVMQKLFQQEPLRLQVGGLPQGSGLALGPALEWRNATDDLRFGVTAVGSFGGFYLLRTAVTLPRTAGNRVSLTLEGTHLDAPKLDYYGPGPDSPKNGSRTDYRREDTSLDLRLRWRPALRHLITNFEIGGLFVNVGPGRNPRLASTEAVYGPGEAPGIDIQSNFLRTGSSVELDFRDIPGDPHRGTHVGVRYDYYSDVKRDRFSFGRVSASAEQYVPLFNEKRVIALRAKTELSHYGRDQLVPFYLQPTLGGTDDLRGFRRYRFHDNNVVALNGEYRWEIFPGFDMAVFADAGKVFHRSGDINLRNLEHSVGFGARFKTRESVAMRIDTGFSDEGFQIWLKFNNVF